MCWDNKQPYQLEVEKKFMFALIRSQSRSNHGQQAWVCVQKMWQRHGNRCFDARHQIDCARFRAFIRPPTKAPALVSIANIIKRFSEHSRRHSSEWSISIEFQVKFATHLSAVDHHWLIDCLKRGKNEAYKKSISKAKICHLESREMCTITIQTYKPSVPSIRLHSGPFQTLVCRFPSTSMILPTFRLLFLPRSTLKFPLAVLLCWINKDAMPIV